MSRESIEVEVESITGEERKAARSQELSQGMDDPMCHVLGAGTELKGRKNLGAGIDGQTEHSFGTAEGGAQFIQLEVREVEMEEESLVQDLRVLTSTSQPSGDRGLTVAEDPLCCGMGQPFSQCREHQGDLVRRGFQTVQRSVTSSAERGVASLTTKRLDALYTAMLAISD
jgi:hypothetical protein